MASLSTPKLLTLNAPTIRNQRTLVWLNNTSSDTVNWSRWDIIVSSLSDYKHFVEKGVRPVGIIVTEILSEEELTELYSISKNVPLILLSQNVLDLKSELFWSENFDNIINLNNILEQYPFIQEEWDGTLDDAVAIFGILFRYNRIVNCTASKMRLTSTPRNITFEIGSQPNQVWMITQFFKHRDSKRYLETKECLKQNCACPYIDKIVLINEKIIPLNIVILKGLKRFTRLYWENASHMLISYNMFIRKFLKMFILFFVMLIFILVNHF